MPTIIPTQSKLTRKFYRCCASAGLPVVGLIWTKHGFWDESQDIYCTYTLASGNPYDGYIVKHPRYGNTVDLRKDGWTPYSIAWFCPGKSLHIWRDISHGYRTWGPPERPSKLPPPIYLEFFRRLSL